MSPRVLHLIPTLQGGGAEHQLAILSSHLPRLGWNVDVAYVHPGVHVERIERSPAVLHHLRVRGNYDPALFYRVVQLIRHLRPDILQTWLPQMDIVGGAASRVTGVPWIITQRSTNPLQGRRFMELIRRSLTYLATAMISNSSLDLENSHLGRAQVTRYYIPNAVQLEEIAAAGRSVRVDALRARGARHVAIAVGRLIALKRFDVFIDAMKRVSSETSSAALICGDGPLREALQARVRAAGLGDSIVFTGFVGDVISDIKSADALVALSEYEGRPNAVIEAMAASTPLVLSDITEHRQILDDGQARFVDGGDPDDVAAALIEVFRDPDTARARARAARTTVEAWDASIVAAEYDGVYQKILSLRDRP